MATRNAHAFDVYLAGQATPQRAAIVKCQYDDVALAFSYVVTDLAGNAVTHAASQVRAIRLVRPVRFGAATADPPYVAPGA